MKIANIDATETICEKVWRFQHFILEVVSSLNEGIVHKNRICFFGFTATSLPLSPIHKFEDEGYENIAYLLHTIPVYLRKSRPERWNEEEDIVDPLGAYYPNRKNDNPYIEMFADKIYSAAISDEQHFMWLFTKVLIHELAHAALDIFNSEHCLQTTEKVLYSTPFGKWREESMANAVALRIIKDFGNRKFYTYVRKFMLSQTAENALGVKMENFEWWDFSSVINGKEYGVCERLQQEWLKYAQGTPSWKGLKKWNEILSSSTVFVYNKRYYIGTQDLVYDIVMDFIKRNRNISYAQLRSAFPNVKVKGKDAYQPITLVQDNLQYSTESNQVLHLSDGDYALLYICWDNSELESFLRIAKSNGFVVDKITNY